MSKSFADQQREQEAEIETLASQEGSHYPAGEEECEYYTAYINCGGKPLHQVTRTDVPAPELFILHYLHGEYNTRTGQQPLDIPGQPSSGFVPFWKPPEFVKKGPRVTKGALAMKYGNKIALQVFPLLMQASFRLPTIWVPPAAVNTSDNWMSQT